MNMETITGTRLSVWERYQNLTPKNQRRFRSELMEGLSITARTHVYNILHERTTISPVMDDFLTKLFEKYYRQQVESVQL